MLYSNIQDYIQEAIQSFDSIPEERKITLKKVSQYIEKKINASEPIELIYVCTHNSRRSHFGQIWGKVASVYYGFQNVNTYSAGTEATAFNPNAIKAMQQAGFEISNNGE